MAPHRRGRANILRISHRLYYSRSRPLRWERRRAIATDACGVRPSDDGFPPYIGVSSIVQSGAVRPPDPRASDDQRGGSFAPRSCFPRGGTGIRDREDGEGLRQSAQQSQAEGRCARPVAGAAPPQRRLRASLVSGNGSQSARLSGRNSARARVIGQPRCWPTRSAAAVRMSRYRW